MTRHPHRPVVPVRRLRGPIDAMAIDAATVALGSPLADFELAGRGGIDRSKRERWKNPNHSIDPNNAILQHHRHGCDRTCIPQTRPKFARIAAAPAGPRCGKSNRMPEPSRG